MASNSSSQFWIDQLLQLNSSTNMTYNESLSVRADLETFINVSKEELKQLKIDVEFKKAEHKYKIEQRDILRQYYEELKCSEKRVVELIKVKNYNCELAKEIYDLRTEKALEQDKQIKELEKQLTDAYRESMNIFESHSLVIKRNQMRNQVAKEKFKNSFLKQKISDLSTVYSNLQNMEKLIEQRKIIKFADAMVKYYKKQKEINEALKNKKTLNDANKIQEQNNNLQVIVETPQQNNIAKLGFLNLNYNFLYKKTESQKETGLKSYMMQTTQSVKLPKLNMNPLQFTPFNLSNYEFKPANYLKSNTSIISKPEHQAYSVPPKSIFQNILNTPKPNWNPLTLPKFDYNLEKYTPKLQTQEKATSQNKQKQKLKRPTDAHESTVKSKILATVKNIQKVHLTSNISKENEKVIFFSQPEKKNTQSEHEFVLLSQGSQKSTTTENLSQKKKSLQQMFNLQPNVPKKTETIEVHKQIPAENIKQGSQNQMFNFQATVPKTTDTNNAYKQNPNNKQTMNKMFDQQTNIPKNNEINKVQKQTSVEYNTKAVNFPNQALPLETKSPYFANQTITSSQGEQCLNTSAGHSEQTINVSSDQPPSQISAADISVSGEYYDTTVHQPMETNQMMTTDESHMIDHNESECNMVQYYEQNPEMQGMEEIQFMSPVLSPAKFLSPPNEEILEENQQNNVPGATNIFGTAQNVGNSFFSFGQAQSKSGGSFFNMF